MAARSYRPDNPVGWLLLGGGVTYASTGGGLGAARPERRRTPAGAGNPGWRLLATCDQRRLDAGRSRSSSRWPCCCSRTARLPSRRWRWLVVADGRERRCASSPWRSRRRWCCRLQRRGRRARLLHRVPSGRVAQVRLDLAGDLGSGGRTSAGRGAPSWCGSGAGTTGPTPADVVGDARGAGPWWCCVLDPVLPDSCLEHLPDRADPARPSWSPSSGTSSLDIRLVFSRSVLYVLLTGLRSACLPRVWSPGWAGQRRPGARWARRWWPRSSSRPRSTRYGCGCSAGSTGWCTAPAAIRCARSPRWARGSA